MTDLNTKWDELFRAISAFEDSPEAGSDEMSTLAIVRGLGSLHLVQPFNWTDWMRTLTEWPSLEQMSAMSLDDCVRFLTMIRRSDRFSEGNLAGAVRSGSIRALCERARHESRGMEVPPLPEIQERQ